VEGEPTASEIPHHFAARRAPALFTRWPRSQVGRPVTLNIEHISTSPPTSNEDAEKGVLRSSLLVDRKTGSSMHKSKERQ
jgi:hypothetical protein